MKNFIRICLLVLAVGGVLCIGGAAAGGTLYSTLSGHGLRPWNWLGYESGTGVRHFRFGSGTDEDDRGTGSGRSNGSVWEGTRQPPAAAELDPVYDELDDNIDGAMDGLDRIAQLKKLDFELGAGEYTIVEGEGYGLEYDGDWIESDIKDGVWKLRTDGVHWPKLRNIDRSCTIVVPAGCTVGELDWVIGAANVITETMITAQKADIEVGAGNLEIDGLTLTGKLDVEVGAGNLEISGLTVGDQVDAEVGMGYLGLDLTGSWSDYRVDAEAAMGSVSINGRDLVSGLVGTASRGDGPRRIYVEASMGAIDITTEEE